MHRSYHQLCYSSFFVWKKKGSFYYKNIQASTIADIKKQFDIWQKKDLTGKLHNIVTFISHTF